MLIIHTVIVPLKLKVGKFTNLSLKYNDYSYWSKLGGKLAYNLKDWKNRKPSCACQDEAHNAPRHASCALVV